MAHLRGPTQHDFRTPGQSEPASYPGSLLEGERAPLLVPEDLERGGSVQYRYGTPTGSSRERGKATLLQQAGNVRPSYLKGDQPEPSSTWGVFKMRSKYYVPALDWLPNYSFSLFWGDFAAGLTVASLVIPMSMSYASGLARLDPLAGLIAAAVPGLIYSLFGSSRQLSVGPEASLSLLVGQAITHILHGDPTAKVPHSMGLAVSTMITFQVGCISFVLGLLRLGFIDVVLSRALLRGFVTAVAVVITIEQLIPMLGLAKLEHTIKPVPVTSLEKFLFIVENAGTHAHWLTATISFGTLVALLGTRAIKRRLAKREGWGWVKFVPEVFLAVVIATALCDEFDWDLRGVDILGSASIKKGAKLFDFPLKHANLKFLKATTSTAILISVVGYLDSVVAAKQNAARFGYSISPNRELVALGAGNLVSSFFPGTLPASRLNADIGGRTQMASVLSSCFIILAVFFLLPALYYLPRSVLASIVCLVVYGLLAEAPEDVGFYIKMRSWVDLALMLVTFVFTLFWSVEVGVVVSVTVSLLLVVHKSSKAHIKILGRVPGTDRWTPIDEDPDAIEDVPGLLIVRVRESLDFANTGQLKERLRRLELYGPAKAHPSEAPRRNDASVVVFHMSDVETIDASAVQIFKELVEQYRERGVSTFFAHLRQEQREKFEKAEIIEIIGEDHITETVADAMAVLERENGLGSF
ncbi:Putative sulfate transporter YPR003C [Saccharomyces cerevisiae S288c] [Rhizoctonia solani]|uniref:Putative sulfate transporter YPR003C [Saccharomyces cerevisiae S288c] n=1 Tax=Rhizoctonia solani TaxID=456999 RepID=A0A0K6FL99_9AGAM|nr:Putative sulfate transporter YPR003C [Saccharomyces cerevisiae S288c] [Rhizoctonia solani]